MPLDPNPGIAELMRYPGVRRAPPPPIEASRIVRPAEPPARRRGICRCGRPRQEHEGSTHTGGIQGTACKRYRP